jgi:hypothetical protein
MISWHPKSLENHKADWLWSECDDDGYALPSKASAAGQAILARVVSDEDLQRKKAEDREKNGGRPPTKLKQSELGY